MILVMKGADTLAFFNVKCFLVSSKIVIGNASSVNLPASVTQSTSFWLISNDLSLLLSLIKRALLNEKDDTCVKGFLAISFKTRTDKLGISRLISYGNYGKINLFDKTNKIEKKEKVLKKFIRVILYMYLYKY
jgi:hypothetical protein